MTSEDPETGATTDQKLVRSCFEGTAEEREAGQTALAKRCAKIAAIVGRQFQIDPDELQNEVILKLIHENFHRLRSFRGDSTLNTWLNRVIHNTAINMAQSRTRYESRNYPLDREEQAIGFFFSDVSMGEIMEFLQKLSPEDRYLIIQRVVFCRDPEELAIELSTTRKNVNVRYHRALSRARELMGVLFNE